MIKQGIIPTAHGQAYTLHDFIEPEVFLSYLEPVYALQGCAWDKDYDGDNRENTKDNCPRNYNPTQYNEDQDEF